MPIARIKPDCAGRIARGRDLGLYHMILTLVG